MTRNTGSVPRIGQVRGRFRVRNPTAGLHSVIDMATREILRNLSLEDTPKACG